MRSPFLATWTLGPKLGQVRAAIQQSINDRMASSTGSGHYGLAGMRERAHRIGAMLDVRSRPGAGTEIELSVPGVTAFGRFGAGSLFRRLRRRHDDESAAPG